MTKYTKYPWEDNGNGIIYGQVSGDDDEAPFVADVCKDGAGGFYSDGEQANARLIVAAPEMLESVNDLLNMLRAAYIDLGMQFDENKRVLKAKAVVAKATGRSA